MLDVLPPEKEYFSIGEASRITGVTPAVLRHWEREFALLRPLRRTSGHRKFTRRDLDSIRRIRELVRGKRFTVEGAKKFLREEARRGPAQAVLPEFGASSAAVETLKAMKAELAGMLDVLRRPAGE